MRGKLLHTHTHTLQDRCIRDFTICLCLKVSRGCFVESECRKVSGLNFSPCTLCQNLLFTPRVTLTNSSACPLMSATSLPVSRSSSLLPWHLKPVRIKEEVKKEGGKSTSELHSVPVFSCCSCRSPADFLWLFF